jgi:hypothetical protein
MGTRLRRGGAALSPCSHKSEARENQNGLPKPIHSRKALLSSYLSPALNQSASLGLGKPVHNFFRATGMEEAGREKPDYQHR